MGSAQAPAFRYGVSASTDRQAWYTVNYERQGSEAGIQVPLLPDPRAGRSTGPHIRVRQVCLQSGTGRTGTRLDAGTAPSHSSGNQPAAYRMETRPRDRMAIRTFQGAVTGRAEAPTRRLQQVLDQAERVSALQEKRKVQGFRDVLPQLLHLPQRADQTGETVGTAGHSMVAP